MSVSAIITQTTLDTILGRLALLFLSGAGNDMAAASDAASQMLAAYNAETPDELALAAQIVSLQLHALEALSHASDPEPSLNKSSASAAEPSASAASPIKLGANWTSYSVRAAPASQRN